VFAVALIVACMFAGALDFRGSFAVPLTAAGLLTCSAPRIIEKVQRARVLQQARVASLAITLFGFNAVAVASVGYLAGRILKLAWF
jgi:predicted PurR-regulated permease PerM